jgi:hypothetical protein
VNNKIPEINKAAIDQSFFVTNLENSTFLYDEPYESKFLARNSIQHKPILKTATIVRQSKSISNNSSFSSQSKLGYT